MMIKAEKDGSAIEIQIWYDGYGNNDTYDFIVVNDKEEAKEIINILQDYVNEKIPYS